MRVISTPSGLVPPLVVSLVVFLGTKYVYCILGPPEWVHCCGPRMQHIYFVPRNTTKLTTRGGTSPDGVEMTLIRESSKSTHCLGTRLSIATVIARRDVRFCPCNKPLLFLRTSAEVLRLSESIERDRQASTRVDTRPEHHRFA